MKCSKNGGPLDNNPETYTVPLYVFFFYRERTSILFDLKLSVLEGNRMLVATEIWPKSRNQLLV